MPVSSEKNLMFFPLYFVYHDQWMFRTWWANIYGWHDAYYAHRGHVHFFMLGHTYNTHGGQAYRGSQEYRFKLEDEWSSRVTTDPNQSKNIRIISKPKWYFWIREFWRRVYIQSWDERSNDDTNPFFVGKKGLKYDASLSVHTHGPYRETRENFFYMTHMARTLPIEYYHNNEKTSRDLWVKNTAGKLPAYTWDWTADGFDDETSYVLPQGYLAGYQNNAPAHDGPSGEFPARNFSYPDSQYIYPIIEYQHFQHLDWERLPGWESRDVDDNNFGDGFEISISIPYKKESVVQSPFSNDNGEVQPYGSYCHGFEDKHGDQILHYPSGNYPFETDVLNIISTNDPGGHNVHYDCSEYYIPPELLGQKVEFRIPTTLGAPEDGHWVEQCLGAIIKAKALVVLEDNFGGRSEVWITGTQFQVEDNFAGIDQNEP